MGHIGQEFIEGGSYDLTADHPELCGNRWLKKGLRSCGYESSFGWDWWAGGMVSGVTVEICAVIRKNIQPSRENRICPLCSHRLPSVPPAGEWVEW